jgi:RNA polymerase-binding protein DksA
LTAPQTDAAPTRNRSAKPAVGKAVSPFTEKELDKFRDVLSRKRDELLGDVQTIREGALRNSRSDAAGDLSAMPIHMADIGSDNYEQEFMLGLMENEQGLLREIEEALQRIDDGSYGLCLATGKRIAKARLKLKPWAKYCVEYVRENE